MENSIRKNIITKVKKEIAYITFLAKERVTNSSFSSLKYVLSFLNWSKMAHKTSINSTTQRAEF